MDPEEHLEQLETPSIPPSPAKPDPQVWRRVRLLAHNPTAAAATLVLVFWLVIAIIGPAIAPYGTDEISSGAVWKAPSAAHLMGTDHLGRDIFSRLLVGARQMVLLPTLSVSLALFLGTSIGLLAGYRGGWIDEIIVRMMDVMMAFPMIMLYLMIIVSIGASAVNVVIALGIGTTPGVSRLVRGLVLDLRNREYVAAAKMRGESGWYIMFHEILPNALGPILVDGLVRIGYACFSMGALGFLGLGCRRQIRTGGRWSARRGRHW
ncbi:MAG: ABC transporter permease [Chloroflexi bacterium]|uniref:ABC transporter permease n=1 Tax=Candidatus Flexifilum breve TaxID=3140694 RepID=UPI00313745BB|nr:ABC transporter permease [Chloroflexota bacterium]